MLKHTAIFFMSLVLMSAADGYAQAPEAPAIEISATVVPRENFIADPFLYTVRVDAAQGIELKPLESIEQMGGLNVRRVQEKSRRRNGGRICREFIYELAGYEVGEQTIPAYAVWYRFSADSAWDRAETKPLTVVIKSMLGQDPQPQLRALKPKLARWDRRVGVLAAVLVLAAIIAGVWRWQKNRKRQLAVAEPALPAHRIALRELEALRREKLIEQGKMEEFYNRLSGCLRRYMENRFRLRAPHMSTEEFLEIAKTSPLVQGEHKRLLRDFLSLADLVKFARYGSSPKEADQAYNAAQHFVEQTQQPETEGRSAEKTV